MISFTGREQTPPKSEMKVFSRQARRFPAKQAVYTLVMNIKYISVGDHDKL